MGDMASPDLTLYKISRDMALIYLYTLSADQLSRFTLDIQGIYHSVKGKNEKY